MWYNPSTWSIVDAIQDPNRDAVPVLGNPFNNGSSDGQVKGANTGNAYDGALYYDDATGMLQQYGNGAWNNVANRSANEGSSGGAYTGGSSYNPQDLQMLDQQKSLYERLLQSIDAAEQSGLQDLNTSETQSRNKANTQRSRQLEDFGVKREDFTRGQEQALNTVGDNSRTLRGSLMRRLGLASGGGSAFDVADNAVARDASKNRAGVQETYGQNFRNLGLAEKRGTEDFQSLLDEIAAERRGNEERFKAGILGQRQGIQQSLAQIMADRAGVVGGNQMAASQPYVNNYMSYQDQIDRLPAQYDTKVQARDLNVQTPTLKDYVVNRANIGGGQTQQSYSPYSNFLRPQQDEEEQQLSF